MADHPNAEKLRRGYDAFERGDMDTLRNETFAPDVVFHVFGLGPLSGDYKGVDEVFSFFEKLLGTTGGNVTTEIHDVLANDTHGVVIGEGITQRDGNTLRQKEVHVVHFDDEGRISEWWGFTEDTAESDRFFS